MNGDLFKKIFSFSFVILFFAHLLSTNTIAAELLFSKELPTNSIEKNDSDLLVTLNSALINSITPGSELIVYLTPDKDVILKVKKVINRPNGTIWKCSISPEYGSGHAMFFVKGTTLAGNILLNGIQYTITSLGTNNIYKIHNTIEQKSPVNPKDFLIPSVTDSQLPQVSYAEPEGSGTTTIDLLILYTPGMASKYPGDALDTYLNMLVELANQAYEDSNIDLTLHIAGTQLVNYPDDSNISDALDSLTNASGVFSNVPTLRNQLGADLVTLIRTFNHNKDAYCGLSWLLKSFNNPSGTYAFSVVQLGTAPDGYTCNDYTLAHEIGHNLGCGHDKAHSSAGGIFSYSYGYGIAGKFGTIMSYFSPKWGYFSNPNITHDGYVLGVENQADNALTIRQTKAFVANYRQASNTNNNGGNTDSVSYCLVQANSQKYEWISGVKIASFYNSSGATKYSNFTSKNITITPGTNVSVQLTPGFASKAYDEYWKIWIDYNKDGDFSDPGELVFYGHSSSILNGSFSVPANVSGSTRLRIMMRYKNYPSSPCTNLDYGEVEDYTVTFSSSTSTTPQPPIANFNASKTTVSVGETVQFTDTSLNNPTTWNWTFQGGTPSSSTAQNPSVKYNTPGDYSVSLTVSNAAGTDTETKTSYIHVTTTSAANYCSVYANSQKYEWISGVKIASFYNSSGATKYSNFTSKNITITPGTNVSVQLTPGFASKAYDEYWKIWIDYNKDGDFSDPGELVFYGHSSSILNGSFSVPANVSGSTRLRIMMRYKNYPSSPCTNLDYGEVEDYTVSF